MSAINKKTIIDENSRHAKDTGSPEVQIALLTSRLAAVTEHNKKFPKDKHSRRGLLRIVAERKKMLSYLHDQDVNRYKAVLEKFSLRR